MLHDGLVYAINQFGTATVLNAANGEVVWEQKLAIGNTVYPSVAAAGNYVFFSSDTGKTVVVKPGSTFEAVRTNTLEPFRSSPVFEGDRMYVRGMKNLYCVAESN